MILNMHAVGPQDLPAWDAAIETGPMGDCVSVIVLWNLVGVAYNNVRGWHGMGGIEAINFNQLFATVPNVATTQVIVVASSTGSVGYLLGNVQAEIFARMNQANVRVVKNLSNARINRSAQVSAVQ